jgi:hypothetical protein
MERQTAETHANLPLSENNFDPSAAASSVVFALKGIERTILALVRKGT